jgi:NhaA family Na+:H+ antiporter
MKRLLPFAIVALVGIITLASGALLYRAKRLPIPAPAKDAALPAGPSESLHVRGRSDAPVTLEEFGDFQCPPCGTLSARLDEIERDYGSRLRVIFREFPLAMHAHAREAAFAAEAAGLQGRFWEMHDLLYREQISWSKAANTRVLFLAYAGLLRLNVAQFQKDIAGPEVPTRVALDQKRGAALGVTSTPTVFVNGRAVPSATLNPASLRLAIDAALKPKPSP